jgi:hypothetical protein
MTYLADRITDLEWQDVRACLRLASRAFAN